MNKTGLTSAEVEESRRKNGSNMLTQIPPDPLWKKILEGFTDPMIIILLVALVIELILWLCGKADWYEPVGIFVAIIIANGVASVSESKQEGRASALKEEEEAKETAKVIRDGKIITAAGMGVAQEFGLEMISVLVSPEKAGEIRAAIQAL